MVWQSFAKLIQTGTSGSDGRLVATAGVLPLVVVETTDGVVLDLGPTCSVVVAYAVGIIHENISAAVIGTRDEIVCTERLIKLVGELVAGVSSGTTGNSIGNC